MFCSACYIDVCDMKALFYRLNGCICSDVGGIYEYFNTEENVLLLLLRV